MLSKSGKPIRCSPRGFCSAGYHGGPTTAKPYHIPLWFRSVNAGVVTSISAPLPFFAMVAAVARSPVIGIVSMATY